MFTSAVIMPSVVRANTMVYIVPSIVLTLRSAL